MNVSTSPRSPAFPLEGLPPATSPSMAKAKMGSTTSSPRNSSRNATDPLKAMLSHTKQPDRQGTNADPKNGGKSHSHRNSSSLVGFDPLLSNEHFYEISVNPTHGVGDNNGIWGSCPDSHNDSQYHPLLGKPISPAHRTSNTICASELRGIAAQLSVDKPRKNTPNEDAQMQTLMTNITLGTSVDDSKLQNTSGGRAPLHPSKKSHRKTQSLASVEEYLMNKLKGHAPHRNTAASTSVATRGAPSPPTPPSSEHSSPAVSTPERHHRIVSGAGATPPSRRRVSPQSGSAAASILVSSPIPAILVPTLSRPSPTSFLKDSDSHALRSSELEPSPHQLEVPAAPEVYLYARLCQLLEKYHDEDFQNLVGKSVLQLRGFVNLGHTVEGLVQMVHEPVARLLLHLNVTVEGYLVDKQSEVAVFSTSSQILVVHRGTTNRQNKPMSKKFKHNATAALDQEHASALIFAPFRDAYFGLEHKVRILLDRLSDENPFAEVVFTGYSFGGALATVAAARFAGARPTVRFECCLFGAPKVGQLEFRQYVHSLPNLKVVRVEYASDPNGAVPVDAVDCKWYHVGHTLAIHQAVGAGKPPAHPIVAYRYDNHKLKVPIAMKLNRLHYKNTVDTYVAALEEFASRKLSWIEGYAGENTGDGVVGRDNEERNMV